MSMYCRWCQAGICLLAWVFFQRGELNSAAFPSTPGPAPSAVLRSIEGKYSRLKTVRVRFRQIVRQDRRALRQEEGVLYLRKPGQMRWEYENPEPKLFLSDGKRLVLYVPAENRVTETSVANSEDIRTPLRFLLGQARFAEEFGRIETSPDFPSLEKGNTVLKAFPKRMTDRLESVLFEVNAQYQIRRLVLNEPGGIQTEFRFEGEQADLPLSEELFRFQPPEGAEVIRQ